jgi:hypothetical protein
MAQQSEQKQLGSGAAEVVCEYEEALKRAGARRVVQTDGVRRRARRWLYRPLKAISTCGKCVLPPVDSVDHYRDLDLILVRREIREVHETYESAQACFRPVVVFRDVGPWDTDSGGSPNGTIHEYVDSTCGRTVGQRPPLNQDHTPRQDEIVEGSVE